MQRQILIGLALTLFIVIFVPVYWAMEPGRQEAASERQKNEAVERGARMFLTNCTTCHGSRGDGYVGPSLKTSELEADVLTIFWAKIIARGRPGTIMPAWSEEDGGPLTMPEMKDLVIFIANWDDALLAKLEAEEAAKATPTPTIGSPEELAAVGRQLFFDRGCLNCHKINGQGGELGPSMVGLFGSEEELTTGVTVTVDHEYLEESIEDPAAKLVAGYPAAMPTLNLSHGQVDALIEFIKSLAE
ncbi:MAG: c-type cytochrome [Dehalococcoidia bacterium]